MIVTGRQIYQSIAGCGRDGGLTVTWRVRGDVALLGQSPRFMRKFVGGVKGRAIGRSGLCTRSEMCRCGAKSRRRFV